MLATYYYQVQIDANYPGVQLEGGQSLRDTAHYSEANICSGNHAVHYVLLNVK